MYIKDRWKAPKMTNSSYLILTTITTNNSNDNKIALVKLRKPKISNPKAPWSIKNKHTISYNFLMVSYFVRSSTAYL